MTCKEHHRRGCLACSLAGCWILAGGDTPGCHGIMPSRPGGALEHLRQFKVLKVNKGIVPKSTLDLGCPSASASWRLCGGKKLKNKGKPDENEGEPTKKLTILKSNSRLSSVSRCLCGKIRLKLEFGSKICCPLT
jgi:hypothetical protein